MPIKISHGPSAVAVGNLAYRTGQLQYLNKRREEEERQQMQAAEMAEKQLMHQQGLQADLFQSHKREQGAMQRLQMQQQFGQIEQQDLFNHQLGMADAQRKQAEQIRLAGHEDDMNQIKLRNNLASDKDLAQMRMGQYTSMYQNSLNEDGKQHLMGMFDQINKIKQDTRISPDQQQEQIDQLWETVETLDEDPLYSIGKEDAIGFSEGWGHANDGESLFIRTRMPDGSWSHRPSLARQKESELEMGVMEDYNLNEKDWWKNNTTSWIENGMVHTLAPDLDTGRMELRTSNRNSNEQSMLDFAELQYWNDSYQDYEKDFRGNDANFGKDPVPFREYVTGRMNDVEALRKPTDEQIANPDGADAAIQAEQEAAQEEAEQELADQHQNAANLLEDTGLPPMPPQPQEITIGEKQFSVLGDGTKESPFEGFEVGDLSEVGAAGFLKPGQTVRIQVGVDENGNPKYTNMRYGSPQ
jgi:hypothetical protein